MVFICLSISNNAGKFIVIKETYSKLAMKLKIIYIVYTGIIVDSEGTNEIP